MSENGSMSDSVATFECEIHPLIDTLLASLETALPSGTFRQLADDALLSTTGSLERLGRLVDARRTEAAGEVKHRSRTTLGSASLAVRKGCHDAVELLRRVTLASQVTVRRRLNLGADTRAEQVLTGELLPPRFPHIATALACGQLGVDSAAAMTVELAPAMARAEVTAVHLAEAELVAAATGATPESPHPVTADE